MDQLQNLINFEPGLLIYLVIDLAIAIALLCAMRFAAGLWAGVDTTQELSQKDNFAFGISLAGSLLALGIVLTGAITGETGRTIAEEAIGMSLYGIIGLLLIKAGRYVHDKWALPDLDKPAEIEKGNISVAIVDAAAVIATALIIRATLLWAEGLDINTLVAILSAFGISQALLTIITRLRENAYSRANQGAEFQEALVQGQLALAIRHSGFLIGTGLALTAASYFLIYEPTAYITNLLGWLLYGLVMVTLLYLLLPLVKKLVLARINLTQEVDQQHNIGVASIEMVLSIAIALVMTALMA